MFLQKKQEKDFPAGRYYNRQLLNMPPDYPERNISGDPEKSYRLAKVTQRAILLEIAQQCCLYREHSQQLSGQQQDHYRKPADREG